ncbi:hypothetical protein [Niabella drilacis]|nr:hypothetical protein [Niabella drilacis]
MKSGPEKLIRDVNTALRRNRKILQDRVKPTERTATVHRNKLLALGFQFNYMTHQYRTKKAQTYIFCYDYGYLPLANNWLLIVRKK